MYMHMSIFLFSGLLEFAVNKFLMFSKFFSGNNNGGLPESLIYMPLGVIYVTLNKKE